MLIGDFAPKTSTVLEYQCMIVQYILNETINKVKCNTNKGKNKKNVKCLNNLLFITLALEH